MPGKGFVSLTDEVPRGSSGRSISCVYKAKPKGFSYAPAFGRGRPVRESRSPVQYEELPSLRQRGGDGFGLPLTHWKCAFDLARARSKIRVRCRASEARRRFRWFEKFGNWS